MFASKNELFTRPSGGYTIARSVRLRSSASAYLNRTFTTPTSANTWTFSVWLKRGILGSSYQSLFGTIPSTGAVIYYGADSIVFWKAGAAVATSTAVYRDPSAWYHLVISSNGTTVTVYINNVSVLSYTGTLANINSANAHYIGTRGGLAEYFDGYLTEINFIDGQALTPSSFGETDSITGVWKAKKYGGTYGTNGFYLNFSDNSNNTAATIGKDYSGNGNNWTPNNISVTTGSTYDSMTDVPTLTSATAANFAVWNQLQKTSTLSQANLLSAGGGSAIFYSVASTISIPSGKWYWEITCVSNTDGLTGIVETNQMIDVIRNGNYVGQTSLGYGYHANGKKYNNATSVAYGATYTTNDIIGVAFNADTGDLTFYKNGTSQGTAYTVSTAYTWLPADSVYASDSKAVNFGQRPFSYTPPTGFVALNTYNLPASTIKNGAAYMAATTYTGNGSTQSISNAVNGVSFQPDWVWFKNRSGANNHALYDSVRGRALGLISNATNAEQSASAGNDLVSFDSNGVSLGPVEDFTSVNGSAQSIVAWQWKAGGTSASNTNGTITSTVSANTTAGFSVVTFTAQTSGTATVGHGLGVAPSMIIVKIRASVSNWYVYHVSTGNVNSIFLNLTNAPQSLPNLWNSTTPTSSVFSLGTDFATSGTMLAYCFSAVAGYSAFGSYTGNGSTDGVFVYLGFRPRYLFTKRTDTTSNWQQVDSSRNPINVTGAPLYPNLSNAESGTSDLDLLSNGFKCRSANSDANASGGTYIYAAFAENPMKYALAR